MRLFFALLLFIVLFTAIYWLVVQIEQYKAEEEDLKLKYKRKNKIR